MKQKNIPIDLKHMLETEKIGLAMHKHKFLMKKVKSVLEIFSLFTFPPQRKKKDDMCVEQCCIQIKKENRCPGRCGSVG